MLFLGRSLAMTEQGRGTGVSPLLATRRVSQSLLELPIGLTNTFSSAPEAEALPANSSSHPRLSEAYPWCSGKW